MPRQKGMDQILELLREMGGVAPSIRVLAREYTTRNGHRSQRYGYEAVQRALKRGRVRLDPTHPDASPTGKGAVVLVPRRYRFMGSVTLDQNGRD